MRVNAGVAIPLVLAVVAVTTAAQQTVDGIIIPVDLPALYAPIMVTTCGQAQGALLFQAACDAIGLRCTVSDSATVEDFVQVCVQKCVEDTAFNVLVITIGASVEGMSSAQVDMEIEVRRCSALVSKAHELGVTVIVAQIEGPSCRKDEYDERSITAMTPLADLLITRSDVNGDGYFTRIAEERGIPQIFIDEIGDLQRLLLALFRVEFRDVP